MTDTLAPLQAPEQPLPETPFVGLVPYGEGDAAFFFGRDGEKAIITANLRAARLTILYGASGVGKTSVLHAGVVRDLHEQVRANAVGRTARTPFAVCAFSAWHGDPIAGLAEAMRAACVEALGGEELPAWQPGEPLLEAVRGWTARVRPLLVVLDQFEEYFLYHEGEDGDGTFAVEFPRLVNELNLRVNFILSLREDAWARLDRFEDSIPSLFENYVRVEHLGRGAAREAIDGPVREWNRRLPPGESAYVVEPELAESVIEAASAGRRGLTEGADGAAPQAADAGGVETPFLQLVLERLWRETVAAGAHTLDEARLEALGGAQRIVENHLLEALGKLTPDEQAVAADCFRFLVTRSKTKIAHPSTDLAEWTKRPEPEVTAVLEKLCRGESGRILRSVSPPAGETVASYELFHDVLAEPILEWRKRYEQQREQDAEAQRLREEQDAEKERRRRRRARRFVVVLVIATGISIAISALAILATMAADKANRRAGVQAAIARKAEEKVAALRQKELAAELVARYEPLYQHATNDAAANCIVGFGHLVHPGPCAAIDRSRWANFTVDRALKLLQSDLVLARTAVFATMTVKLKGYQISALEDFAYNAGGGALRGGVGRGINSGHPGAALNVLMEYDHVGHQVLPALCIRRADEARLFTTGVYPWDVENQPGKVQGFGSHHCPRVAN